ncbi:MAG: ABC transporter substrate-binding protein [Acholeplasmataceae bacterium]|jgi:iron complex transport system substrate-binding protein|nr:ABC transporter substrate-binding protein [Acholeplasmataceae bacterium]
MKKIHILVFIIALLSVLGACSKLDETENEFEREEVTLTFDVTSGALANETNSGWTGGTRVSVTKTFKTNPKAVAIFAYDALDMIDAVGYDKTSIKELGVPKNNIPTYLNAYNTTSVVNVGTLFVPDWDALDLFMPDLIIINSRSAGAYDQLSENYPYADILDVTLVNGEYLEGMTRNVNNLAKIFPSIADELQEKLTEITSSMETIKQTTKDHEALFIMVNGEALSFYGPTGRFAVLYDEFGFIPSDDKAEEGGSHGNVIGYEYVASVNPEILFLLDRGVATGGSSSIDTVINNQLIKGTEAGQNDHMYTLDPIAWYISAGGFQSTDQMIEDLMVTINALS